MFSNARACASSGRSLGVAIAESGRTGDDFSAQTGTAVRRKPSQLSREFRLDWTTSDDGTLVRPRRNAGRVLRGRNDGSVRRRRHGRHLGRNRRSIGVYRWDLAHATSSPLTPRSAGTLEVKNFKPGIRLGVPLWPHDPSVSHGALPRRVSGRRKRGALPVAEPLSSLDLRKPIPFFAVGPRPSRGAPT